MDSWDNKNPVAFDYIGFQWIDDLAADEAITASSWAIIEGDAALLLETPSIDAATKVTTTFTRNGTPDASYKIRNVITTNSFPPRTLVKEGILNIR